MDTQGLLLQVETAKHIATVVQVQQFTNLLVWFSLVSVPLSQLGQSLASYFVLAGKAVAGMPQDSCEPIPSACRSTLGRKNSTEHLDEDSNICHDRSKIQKPTSVCSLSHVMLSIISCLRSKKQDSDCSRWGSCYLQFAASKIFRACNGLIIEGDRTATALCLCSVFTIKKSSNSQHGVIFSSSYSTLSVNNGVSVQIWQLGSTDVCFKMSLLKMVSAIMSCPSKHREPLASCGLCCTCFPVCVYYIFVYINLCIGEGQYGITYEKNNNNVETIKIQHGCIQLFCFIHF